MTELAKAAGDTPPRSARRGPGRALTALAVGVVLAAGALSLRQCESGAPTLVAPERIHLGRDAARVEIRGADTGVGLRSLRAELVHAGGAAVLLEHTFAASRLGLTGPADAAPLAIPLDAAELGLAEGHARLRLSLRDRAWRRFFRGNETRREISVVIDLTPPTLRMSDGLSYVRRGGAGALRYWVEGAGARDGVEVGGVFFPGVPTPDAAGGLDDANRLALFAVPIDAPQPVVIRAVAEDRANNRRERRTPVRVIERSFPDVELALPQRFFQDVVPELAADLGLREADPERAFRDINSRVRAANEARIRELTAESRATALFAGPFHQLRNSLVTSRFAERRRYTVKGEELSRATHFGYDLAATLHSPIGAANAGRVVFAGELGIYGNCVLLDHGLGLATLYGHLSRIDVTAGQSVARDETLGRSGATGLAGGDHLHFAVLIRGVYVDPLEWWDAKWFREHIEAKLPAGTPSP